MPAKLALAHPAHAVKPSAAGSVNYVADWVMDAVDDLIGRFDQDIVVETSIDPALQNAAERALAETLAQKGEKFGVGEGALVAMTPDGVRARAGRRHAAIPRASSTAPSPPSVSPARRSSRSSISPRSSTGSRPTRCARTGRSR